MDALRSTDEALTEAIADKNLERIVSFYADDASILPVQEPIVSGKEAIRDEWEQALAIPGFSSSATATKAEVSRAGDLGYTQGTFSTGFELIDGTTGTERGKYVAVWKKRADGIWKVAVEISNTDAPPPPHAHPPAHAECEQRPHNNPLQATAGAEWKARKRAPAAPEQAR